MKIQINSTGKFKDVPLRVAQRMINKGIAHIVKEVKPKVKIEEPIIFRESEIEEVKPKRKRAKKIEVIEDKEDTEKEWYE